MLKDKILELRSTIDQFKKEILDKVDEARKLADADAVDEALKIKDEIDAKKAELVDLEKKLEDLQGVADLEAEVVEETKEAPSSEEQADKEDDEEDETPAKSEDEEDKKEKEERKLNLNEKEDVKMKEVLSNEVLENGMKEEVRSFEAYVRTKGQERAFKSVDGGAVIPIDQSYTPKDEVATELDLRKLVNVVPVKSKSGSYPVLKATDEKMVTVAELAANPELANPKFVNVSYDVETYRGYIPVSEESIADSAIDLTGLIQKHIARIARNTSNAKIAEVLKGFTPVAAANLDDIKKVLNVTLNPNYSATFVVTQSFFNAVDTLKDANGRYILTESISNGSTNFQLFGRKVVIVEDKVLGVEGDKIAFVGDLAQAVLFADRSEAYVKWVDNSIYGQLLAGNARFDVVAADTDAGFLVTLA